MKKLTFLLCALVCASALSAQTYYITGNSTTLFGASWDPAHMELDAQEDGTYAKTFTTCVIDKEYQFKVTDGTWDNTWGFEELATVPEGVTGVTEGTGKNNIVCTTYDANMTVVFDPTAGKITLTGVFKGTPKPLSYFALHGNFTGGWKDTDNFTISDDASTATLSMTLSAGSYEFGARIGSKDNWSSSGETITRTSNSADFTKSGGNNKLTADVAGTYTFTYTAATKVLAVTYPEATGDEGGEGGEGDEGGEGEGNTTDYYLVGTINGANYGCEEDYANIGEYKFVGGKLTATFTEQSYVFVKTGDNNNWYMSETYVDAAESATTTLKTAGETVGEKLGVPGNVEVHFTLTENGDGTLTLAYTTESTALQAITVADIYANNGRIYGAEGMRIYTVSGMDVTDQNGQLNGIYIVKAQAGVYKIVVK